MMVACEFSVPDTLPSGTPINLIEEYLDDADVNYRILVDGEYAGSSYVLEKGDLLAIYLYNKMSRKARARLYDRISNAAYAYSREHTRDSPHVGGVAKGLVYAWMVIFLIALLAVGLLTGWSGGL
jgi:hypothetical protein